MNDKDTAKIDHGKVVPKRGLHLSWAWLFPILAALATTWLFWSNWRSNGPEVEIQFDTAPGIQVGKTPLIYRGVTAGKVTGLRLDKDLDKVVLVVRLKAFASELAREGTVFWIDQPVVGLGNTSGLDALIQGNSLQAVMGDGPPTTRFTGSSDVPLTPLESPALVLKLRAANIPFLDRGSPLYYRGVAVGMVEDKLIDDQGRPYLQVVVEKKFASAVRSNARFWPVPATSMKIGPSGVKLELLGLKAILLGGVEFDVFGPPGDATKTGAEFTLYKDQGAATATGQPVRISFRNGQGILAGQTEIRRLGIPVGLVESAKLNESTQTVDTVVRFQPAFEQLHNEGAEFTLIRPSVSLDGISGLDTLISGVYIECDPGKSTKLVERFEGRTTLDEGSLLADSESGGIRISLSAKTLPRLGDGAPVYYRGLLAGRVTGRGLGPNGDPHIDIVIRKEYASYVTGNARFWPVSGTSVQAGPGLLNIDVAGVQSLILGGLAFDVFDKPTSPAGNGAEFRLFANEPSARAVSDPIRVSFDNGQGLLAGQTQVRYLGLPIGLVESVTAKNGKVEAVVRLDAGYESLCREGSSFAVVRLNVSLDTGVSGLETALSGVYIECVPAASGSITRNFTGVSLGKANFEAAEEQGLEVVVMANHSNIGIGAPVAYRGLIVGKVDRKILSNDAGKIGLCVVIDPAHANLIRTNTKFWDASGVKVTFGFFNLKVQTGSIDALARGGLAFATPDNVGMGPKVKRGHEFELFPEPRKEWLKWAPTLSSGN